MAGSPNNATVAHPGLSSTPSFNSLGAHSSNSPATVIHTSVAPVSQQAAPTTANNQAATSNSPAVTSDPSKPTPVKLLTSVITKGGAKSGAASGEAASATTITITSSQSGPLFPVDTNTHTTSSKHTSRTSSGSAALATSGASSTSSGSLSAGGKIAIAVVVPVISVALLVLAGLFLWRRRKQRKDAEELRRKEVEDYGFNPNNDPTLPAIAGASSSGDDPSEMRETDGSGYRGWGTTATTRKASTTLSSGNGPIGVARSGSGSDPGGYHGSPPTGASYDGHSDEPLVGSPGRDRPITADSETIGALGAAPAASGNRSDKDIKRGTSNASSAYSGAHRSDTSGEGAVPNGAPGQNYYNEGLYYDDGMPNHGPYGDGSYGGGQPVIRDVQARRNTRIENPAVYPQQGNAGISQNF